MLQAGRRRLEAEHNGRAWLAYNVAVLSSVATNAPKKLPKMQSLMIGSRPRRQQTWREQMQICRMLTVAYGGTVH